MAKAKCGCERVERVSLVDVPGHVNSGVESGEEIWIDG
jgi:hypothetical protein